MGSLSNKVRSPWVVMPVVAALGLGGWLVVRSRDHGSAAPAATTNERIVQATVGTMARTVSADGTVAAVGTDDLSFTSAGTVSSVDVAAGDTVTKGQVLATLDAPQLAADVSAAQASLADAQAKLSDDTAAGASSEQLAADQASVVSAQDQLTAAQTAQSGDRLVASIDGTVASVDLTVGEQLGSGGTGGTSTTGSASGSGASAGNLGSGNDSPFGGGNAGSGSSAASTGQIQLITTGKFSVKLGFDSTDIANLHVGEVASIAVSTSSSGRLRFPGGFGGFGGGFGRPGADATGGSGAGSGSNGGTGSGGAGGGPSTGGGAGVQGVVTEVGTVADASSGVTSYPVTVVFADTSGTFNVGTSVTVAITYEQVQNAVQVPSFAISTASDGTQSVVVQTESGNQTRTVTTGLTAGAMTQITSGLQGGESVVITFGGGGGAGGGPGGGGTGGFQPSGGATDVRVAPGGGS